MNERLNDLKVVLGDCSGLTEPCECLEPSQCEWCGSAGWLTPKVKQLKAVAIREELANAEIEDVFLKIN